MTTLTDILLSEFKPSERAKPGLSDEFVIVDKGPLFDIVRFVEARESQSPSKEYHVKGLINLPDIDSIGEVFHYLLSNFQLPCPVGMWYDQNWTVLMYPIQNKWGIDVSRETTADIEVFGYTLKGITTQHGKTYLVEFDVPGNKKQKETIGEISLNCFSEGFGKNDLKAGTIKRKLRQYGLSLDSLAVSGPISKEGEQNYLSIRDLFNYKIFADSRQTNVQISKVLEPSASLDFITVGKKFMAESDKKIREILEEVGSPSVILFPVERLVLSEKPFSLAGKLRPPQEYGDVRLYTLDKQSILKNK